LNYQLIEVIVNSYIVTLWLWLPSWL